MQTASQARQFQFKPVPINHPANSNGAHPRRHSTVTSVPSNTLSEMERRSTLTSVFSNAPSELQGRRTLTSVPSNNTPSDFQKQLSFLSHQKCYKNMSQGVGSSELSLAQAAQCPLTPESVFFSPAPNFPYPKVHEGQPWFGESQPISPAQDSEEEHSCNCSSDESKSTPSPLPPLPPPPRGMAMPLEGNGDFLLPQTPGMFAQTGSLLSQINEGDECEGHEDSVSLSSSNLRPDHQAVAERDRVLVEDPNARQYERLIREGAQWTTHEERRRDSKVFRDNKGVQEEKNNPTSPVGYLSYKETSIAGGSGRDDPDWYQQRDSLQEQVDGSRDDEREGSVQRHSYQDNTGASNHHWRENETFHSSTRPMSEADATPLPYETSSSLAVSCDSLDPTRRPLPPPPPNDAPADWWKSPSPSSSTFSSPPPGMRSRTGSTSPTKALRSSPLTKRVQHQMSLDADKPPEPVQDWAEFQKQRYKKLQMKSTSEDRLDEPGPPLSHPFNKRHHSITAPPNAAQINHHQNTGNHHTSSKPRPQAIPHIPFNGVPPPLAKHTHLKRVQSAQPLVEDSELPNLTVNPMYQQRVSDTLPASARNKQPPPTTSEERNTTPG